jgi:hypothetical protein
MLQGAALERQGQYARAESIFREAIRVARNTPVSTFGVLSNLRLLKAMDSLAIVCDEGGRQNEAERLLREVIREIGGSVGTRSLEYAIAASNLAAHYLERGMLPQSELLFTEAIAIVLEADKPLPLNGTRGRAVPMRSKRSAAAIPSSSGMLKRANIIWAFA